MDAKYNGEKWIIEMTAAQYQEMVVKFFIRNPLPSCDELTETLVPTGIPNSAQGKEGRFGTGRIVKYVFTSSDGVDLMVKCHDSDSKVAARKPKSNAANGWTTQIVCNNCSFFTWNKRKKKAGVIAVSLRRALRGLAPRCDSAHIPLRSGPVLVTKD